MRSIHSLPPTGIAAGTLASWIVWSLWISRNQLIFENREFTPVETLRKALSYAREWTVAQMPSTNQSARPLIGIEPRPLRPGECSVFTDAAWNATSGNAGLGWIVDDAASSTQHSATSTLVTSPLMAEFLAVNAAITFALSCGFDAITIFSDSQVLVNTIKRKEMKLEIYGILQDIYQLSSSFMSFKIVFIPRVDNSKADLVAKHALWALDSSS